MVNASSSLSGQLADESSRFASVTGRTGRGAGARACFIMLPKLPELFIALLGGLKARAVVGPLFANSAMNRS